MLHVVRQDPEDAEAEKAARTAEVMRQLERSDVAWLMSEKRGRRLAWRYFNLTGIPTGDGVGASDGSFPFDSNALTMARNCGRQELMQRIFNIAWSDCPKDLLLGREENA